MGGSIVKVTTLLIILSIALAGNTQNVFNKAFDESNAANHTANILEHSNHFFFTQKSFISGNAVLEALILDTAGQLLQKKSLVVDNNFNIFYGYAGSLQHLTNNEFCQQYHIALDSTIKLIFFDDNLNVIRNTHYNFGNYVTSGVIEQINDSTLLILGRVKNITNYNLFLINTDIQGNERWRTIFGETGKDDFGFAIEYINNEIVIGGQSHFSSSTVYPHLFKFSNTGQLILDTIYTQFNNGVYLAYDSQYGLFFSASTNNNSNTQPVVGSINLDFSINWSSHFFTNDQFVHINQMTINSQGIITMAGTKLINGEFSGLFFQANAQGDSLGSKIIDHLPNELAAFNDIRSTSDGGYIMAGQTRAPSQDSWIVKVNEWGCDELPCTVSVAEQPEKDNGEIHCYPNPSNGIGTIKGSFRNAHFNNEIKVFNSLGQLVFSKNLTNKEFEMEVNLTNSGLYLVNLYQGNSLIESLKWVVN